MRSREQHVGDFGEDGLGEHQLEALLVSEPEKLECGSPGSGV
jgi:hypothetical protein